MTCTQKPIVLGKGSFGGVVLGKLKGKCIVIKKVHQQSNQNNVEVEAKILSKLSHPNIVSYIEHRFDYIKKSVYIAMEFCERGDLRKLIRSHQVHEEPIPLKLIYSIFTQIAHAIQAIHILKNGVHILHGDMKPENIFLDKYCNVKLGDFGSSEIIGDYTTGKRGTEPYMSPEMKEGIQYSTKSDMWSFGVILYELCHLKYPFTYNSETKNFEHTTLKFERKDVSRYFLATVVFLLQREPEVRLSVLDVIKCKKFSEMRRIGEFYRHQVKDSNQDTDVLGKLENCYVSDWEDVRQLPKFTKKDRTCKIIRVKPSRICFCQRTIDNLLWALFE